MSTINRITGLASGMDTEAIIEQLMNAEKIPLTKLEKSQTKVEWQRQALLDINSKLLSFRSTTLDMKLQGSYKIYNATSSNSSVATATTTTDVEEGIYSVCVKQLASKTTMSGRARSDSLTAADIPTNSLDLSGKEFTMTVNGETKTIKFENNGDYNFIDGDESDITSKLQAKIDEAWGTNQVVVSATQREGNFSISFTPSDLSINKEITLGKGKDADALSTMGFTDLATNIFDGSKTLGSMITRAGQFVDGKMDVCVNGKRFTFTENQTFDEAISIINKDSEADVTISYNEFTKTYNVTRDSSGEGKGISFNDPNSSLDSPVFAGRGFWDLMGIRPTTAVTQGTNAIVSMTTPDGKQTGDVEVTSNNFTYGGVSMTLLKAAPEETVQLTVSKDVDAIYDKISKFVDSYNDMLTTMNKAYKQEVSGYEPLTDEEKKSLSDTQEEQWESKAKEGILRRDSTIGSAISSMRTAVTQAVTGLDLNSLFNIGISTSSYDSVNSENNGKLVIDKDKLTAAIKNDIDGVASLFSASPKQVSGTKLEDTNIDFTGKSFNITYGGSTKTIEVEGTYDLSDSDQVTNFEDYLKGKFSALFGESSISVSYTGGKILVNSLKGVSLTLNSGANDALAELGIEDGSRYDPTQKGFATKVYDIATTTMNAIVDRAGATATVVDTSVLGKKLKEVKTNISKLQDRLDELEKRYYNQFSAMEQAINNMNSQSSSLTSMLSSS